MTSQLGIVSGFRLQIADPSLDAVFSIRKESPGLWEIEMEKESNNFLHLLGTLHKFSAGAQRFGGADWVISTTCFRGSSPWDFNADSYDIGKHRFLYVTLASM